MHILHLIKFHRQTLVIVIASATLCVFVFMLEILHINSFQSAYCSFLVPQSAAADDHKSGGAMTNCQLNERGKALRSEIDREYADMKKTGNLPKANGPGKDVSEIVLKYIPVDSPFYDAEIVLKAAGVDLAESPPRQARPQYPDYDRFSIRGGMMLQTLAGGFGKTEFVVVVSPQVLEKTDTVVKMVDAWVAIDFL